jgi:hypothetical protein
MNSIQPMTSNENSGINFDQLDKKYAFEPALYK